MSAQLRPYQVRSIEAMRVAIRNGVRHILLVIPTGGGKTITAAALIIAALGKGKRSLFVAHRKELIDQTVATFARLGITTIGVIRAGDRRRNPKAPIQIASIQTLARREQQEVDLVIVDEAHRSPSASYTKHLFERHPNAVIIGLSATPVRADNRPLGTHFKELVVGAKYSELIEGQHIVEPCVYSTPVLPDLSSVRTSGGDFNRDDLEEAMNRGALIGDLYTQWAKHPRQRTVAFAVSVAHSKEIVKVFTDKGVSAEHLDGTTPEEERAAILARLESGKTELVSNVGVLCEGWDMPSCKTLIVARPTKSLSLWMQMAGRILRPFFCPIAQRWIVPIVLDHGGNVDRHGLPHEDRDWSLSKKPKKKGEARVKTCPTCFAYVASGCSACPHCGHVFTVAGTVKDVEPIPVDLELRTLSGDDAKLSAFRRLYRECRDRGWKYGAAIHRYVEKFGEDPPFAWIQALKSDFAGDREWKERVKAKQAAKRAAEEAEAEHAA